jgi:hypothetical protein
MRAGWVTPGGTTLHAQPGLSSRLKREFGRQPMPLRLTCYGARVFLVARECGRTPQNDRAQQQGGCELATRRGGASRPGQKNESGYLVRDARHRVAASAHRNLGAEILG